MGSALLPLVAILASAPGQAGVPTVEPTPTWTPADRRAPEPPPEPPMIPGPPAPPPPQPAPEAPAAVPGPPARDLSSRRSLARRRHQVVAGIGPAAVGAPEFVVGWGLRLGSLGDARLDATVLLGWSSREEAVPVSPAWNDGFDTFQSAEWSARTFLLELAGWWDAGPVLVRTGAGLHLSFVQFSADYTFTGCYDILCSRTYDGASTDYATGSTQAAALLSAGVHLPIRDRFLVGVDLRWLAPMTSTVTRFQSSSRLGGLGAAVTATLRLGR